MTDLTTLRAVFDGLREPVLYLVNDIVEYQNPAAAELLPDGLTAELRERLEEEERPLVLLSGKLVRPQVLDRGEERLVILHPADGGGLERRLPLLLEELRGQLNNLMAVAHLVTPELLDSGGANGEYLAIMNQSFYRLLRLTQNAQLAEEMAEGAVAFHPAGLDLAGFCRELWGQVEPLAEAAGRSFAYESGTDSLLTTGDEALLRRLVLELAANALRGAGQGGKAGLRLTAAGRRAVLTVWDNGPGLDLAELERPDFSPRPEGGLRLGLSSARYIAALHGGAVMVDSRPGEGTRVTVSLPIQKPAPGTVQSPKGDPAGGFSPVLVALSGVLPYDVFRAEDIE